MNSGDIWFSNDKPIGIMLGESKPRRRIVDVFIVDTHPAVPVEHALLYSKEKYFTDKTDEELFLDADIQGLLKKHNAKRVTWENTHSHKKGEKLPPARLHDLRRIVGTACSI